MSNSSLAENRSSLRNRAPRGMKGEIKILFQLKPRMTPEFFASLHAVYFFAFIEITERKKKKNSEKISIKAGKKNFLPLLSPAGNS